VRLNVAYLGALETAGLAPVVLPPSDDVTTAERLLDVVDGLVLSGGEDVDPVHYGAAPDARTHPAHRRRDACELALLRRARDLALPTLAICRGLQVANVALGGTLVQDVASQVAGARPHDESHRRDSRLHEVRIDPDTRLAAALGATTIDVNSSHHQAVDRIAPGLRVTAVSPDGVIEGAEWSSNDWWMVGVQWHPEELIDTPEPWDRRLFAAFAIAVGQRLEARGSRPEERKAEGRRPDNPQT
jgi:putative glutamine amidotransferase